MKAGEYKMFSARKKVFIRSSLIFESYITMVNNQFDWLRNEARFKLIPKKVPIISC